MNAHLEFGLTFEDEAEFLIYAMFNFWSKGINPTEFKKCTMADIRTMMRIEDATAQRIKNDQLTLETKRRARGNIWA